MGNAQISELSPPPGFDFGFLLQLPDINQVTYFPDIPLLCTVDNIFFLTECGGDQMRKRT